jgi:hypothetical protein
MFGIVTRLYAGRSKFRIPAGNQVLFKSKRPDWLWGSAVLLFGVYRRYFPKEKRLVCDVDQSSSSDVKINPLNAELNPICHLLILLGDLAFMGPCIVSIFQYISNKMQHYTVYLYLETALLHVSSGTSTHHQERIQLYLQHLAFVTPLLLSAAIVEALEPV